MLDRGLLQKHAQALEKGNEASRREAIHALKMHPQNDWAAAPQAVCRALVVTLQQQLVGTNPPLVLKEVAAILGNMGPHSNSAVPQLIELLRAGVPDPVRDSAAVALGKFGSTARQAVEPLLTLAAGRDNLGSQALRALAAIGCADQRVRQGLTSLWLVPATTPNWQLHLAVAMCKLGIDAPGVLAFLIHHVMSSQDNALRKAAAAALAWSNKKELDVVPALLSAAIGDRDEEVRKIAQSSLDHMRLSQDQALELCAKQLKNSVHAESVLRKSGPQAVPALIDALGTDDPTTKLRAAAVLAHLGEPAVAAAPALSAMLNDKNPELRLMAAKGLWNTTKQADPVIPVLVDLLDAKKFPGGEDDESRRRFLQTVLEALWRMGPPAQAALPALRAKTKDKNRLVRESAQYAITRIEATAAAK